MGSIHSTPRLIASRFNHLYLQGRRLAETPDRTPNGGGSTGVQAIGTSGVAPLARPTGPDASGCPLHGSLSAEEADVLRVLGNFYLLHLLTERGTITGSVLSDDSNLLGALGLKRREEEEEQRMKGKTKETHQ